MDMTPRKRSVILALTQNTSTMQREIGTKFSVGVATVHRITHQYKETGVHYTKEKGELWSKKENFTN